MSRIAIRENYTDADGNLRARRQYEWVAPGIASQTANEDYNEISYLAAGLDREALSRKQAFHGNVRDFPEALRIFFEKGGVKSVLMSPYFRRWSLVGVHWLFRMCSGTVLGCRRNRSPGHCSRHHRCSYISQVNGRRIYCRRGIARWRHPMPRACSWQT